MSEPFLAEIKIVGFNFPVRGWAQCDGQLLPINQNQALFSLLGTNYGGDGRTTFALPDLRGRVPLHEGTGFPLGSKGGAERHTLSVPELPAHAHTVDLEATTGDANSGSAAGRQYAHAEVETYTSAGAADPTMDPTMIGNTGGGQQHENMQPFLTLNFQIALQGLFPSRN